VALEIVSIDGRLFDKNRGRGDDQRAARRHPRLRLPEQGGSFWQLEVLEHIAQNHAVESLLEARHVALDRVDDDDVVKVPQCVAVVGPSFDAEQERVPRPDTQIHPLPDHRSVEPRPDPEVEHAPGALGRKLLGNMRDDRKAADRHGNEPWSVFSFQ